MSNIISITGGKESKDQCGRIDRDELVQTKLLHAKAVLHALRMALRCRDTEPSPELVQDTIWAVTDMLDEVDKAFEALSEKPAD